MPSLVSTIRKQSASFSKGIKKQAAFTLAPIHIARLFVFGRTDRRLDPVARKLVWKLIVDEVAEKQMTVLVSSHNLSEMEGICDSIGIISKAAVCTSRKNWTP